VEPISFTVNLLERRSCLLTDRIELLREAIRKVLRDRPFHIDAWVIMPNHMHAVWTLPQDDHDYSGRWREIKKYFVKALPQTERRSAIRKASGERGIWQRRFWEHTIRDEADYAAHVNYVHFNPVKHGWVTHAVDWPFSTFHRAVAQGIYPADWTGATETPEAANGEIDTMLT
jgi:putative transposase